MYTFTMQAYYTLLPSVNTVTITIIIIISQCVVMQLSTVIVFLYAVPSIYIYIYIYIYIFFFFCITCIPSSFWCLCGNYGVISDVIIRKFRASMEIF